MDNLQTISPAPPTAARSSHRSDCRRNSFEDIQEALSRYFDIMYECGHSRLDEIFAASAQLHGYRDGDMIVWTIPAYRGVLAARASPMSLGAQRKDEILLIDIVFDDMALTKVRLRINELVFVDYLTWHRFGQRWLITAKGFHLAG